MSKNKLKENKVLLNEDLFTFFGGVALIALAGWALKKIGFMATKSELAGVSDRVADSLDDIYNDKELVKDFVAILRDSGNIDSIVDKSRSDLYKDFYPLDATKRDRYIDRRDWNEYIKHTIDDWRWNADASKIAHKLVKSSGFIKFSKKHKFDSKDNEDMIKLFYFIISRPDFAKTAKLYLYNMVDKDTSVSVKAIKLKDLIPVRSR